MHKLEVLRWGRALKWWSRWLVTQIPHLLSKTRLRRAKRVGYGIIEEEEEEEDGGLALRNADEVSFAPTDSDMSSEDEDYDPRGWFNKGENRKNNDLRFPNGITFLFHQAPSRPPPPPPPPPPPATSPTMRSSASTLSVAYPSTRSPSPQGNAGPQDDEPPATPAAPASPTPLAPPAPKALPTSRVIGTQHAPAAMAASGAPLPSNPLSPFNPYESNTTVSGGVSGGAAAAATVKAEMEELTEGIQYRGRHTVQPRRISIMQPQISELELLKLKINQVNNPSLTPSQY